MKSGTPKDLAAPKRKRMNSKIASVLSAAGLWSTFIWSPAAAQPANQIAYVTVTADIAHNFVRKLLPLSVSVPAHPQDKLWLGDLYFCGSPGPSSSAKVLGMLYPGSPPAKAPEPMLHASDCSDTAALGTGLNPKASAIAAAMHLAWAPWQVTLSIDQASVVGPADVGLADDAGALSGAHAIVFDVSTSRTMIPVSDNVKIPADLSLTFDRESVQATFYEPGSGAPAAPTNLAQLSGPENLLIVATYGAVNRELSQYFPVPYDGALGGVGQARLTGAAIEGQADTLKVTGTLSIESGGRWIPLASEIDLTGADLAGSVVTMTPTPAACAGQPPTCNALVDGIGRAVAKIILTRIKDLRVRPANYLQPRTWTILGQTVKWRLDVIQASASAGALTLRGIAKVE